MSITPAELAQLAITSRLFVTADGDLDCPDILSCSNCQLFNSDSESCRFWSTTPDFIPLNTRHQAIAYLHSNHPEFFL